MLVTLLFGLFGLIPAGLAAGRARQLSVSPGRYWRAFGLIFGAQLLVPAAVILYAVLASTGGTFLPVVRPTTAAYADDSAPSTRPPGTRAPVTRAPATQAAAPQAPATDDTVTTRGQGTGASRPADQPGVRAITSLPSGSWLTVLDSMPKSQRGEQEAWAMANGLSGSARVVVVDSDRIPGLNAGYWAIAITGSSSRNEANGWCSVMNRPVGGTCYPRQVG